jgi:prepilin-type N-terminal cleavage/methylation domain-containing protein
MDYRHSAVARRGMNITELLVVVAIITILISISMPAIQSVRENSRRTACAVHLSQIGLALYMYHEAQGAFPIGCMDAAGKKHNWAIHLLKFLEQRTVFEKYKFEFSCRAPENREATSTVISTYLCPSTTRISSDRTGAAVSDQNGNGKYDAGDGMGCMDYGGIFGDMRALRFAGNGMMRWDHAVKLKECRDGLAYTMIVAEITGRGAQLAGEWANGDNLFDVTQAINTYSALQPGPFYENEIWSDHPGGAYMLTVDTVTHFLRESVDPKILSALATRAGGEQDAKGAPIRVPEN